MSRSNYIKMGCRPIQLQSYVYAYTLRNPRPIVIDICYRLTLLYLSIFVIYSPSKYYKCIMSCFALLYHVTLFGIETCI